MARGRRYTFRLEGFRELERALAEELPRVTAKNALRRAGMRALDRLDAAATALAPKDTGRLARSITIKPVKAKRISRTRFARSQGIEIAVGPTGPAAGGKAAWQEFGTVHQPPQPYMRPAFDAEAEGVLHSIRQFLTGEIAKAKARIARKAARKL